MIDCVAFTREGIGGGEGKEVVHLQFCPCRLLPYFVSLRSFLPALYSNAIPSSRLKGMKGDALSVNLDNFRSQPYMSGRGLRSIRYLSCNYFFFVWYNNHVMEEPIDRHIEINWT